MTENRSLGFTRYGSGPMTRRRKLSTPTSGPQHSSGLPTSQPQNTVYFLSIPVVVAGSAAGGAIARGLGVSRRKTVKTKTPGGGPGPLVEPWSRGLLAVGGTSNIGGGGGPPSLPF